MRPTEICEIFEEDEEKAGFCAGVLVFWLRRGGRERDYSETSCLILLNTVL